MVKLRDELGRAAWGLALTAGALTLLTYLPILPSWAERLVPFRLHAAVAATLLSLLLFALRLPQQAAVWLLLAAANGLWVPPRALPVGTSRLPTRPLKTRPLTVLTYNVNSDSVRYEDVMNTIRGVDADVVILEELSPKWKQQLVALGDFKYRSMYPDDSNWGFGILSRLPIVSSELLPWSGIATAYGVRAELRMGGSEEGEGVTVTVIGLHPVTPVDDPGGAERDAQLAAAAKLAQGVTGPLIVMGDLNATPWTRQFRALLFDGHLRDAAAWRWVGATWPTQLGPFGLPLDHILVGGSVDVDEVQVAPGTGSDHFGLAAKLAVWDPATRY